MGVALVFPTICSTMQNAHESITVTKKDNGQTVHIAPGCTLILKLEAIPGTGYAWHIVRDESPFLLRLQGEPIFEPNVEAIKKKPLGAPAFQVFRFKAEGEGTNILELHYKKKWETEEEPQEKFSITVHIQ